MGVYDFQRGLIDTWVAMAFDRQALPSSKATWVYYSTRLAELVRELLSSPAPTRPLPPPSVLDALTPMSPERHSDSPLPHVVSNAGNVRAVHKPENASSVQGRADPSLGAAIGSYASTLNSAPSSNAIVAANGSSALPVNSNAAAGLHQPSWDELNKTLTSMQSSTNLLPGSFSQSQNTSQSSSQSLTVSYSQAVPREAEPQVQQIGLQTPSPSNPIDNNALLPFTFMEATRDFSAIEMWPAPAGFEAASEAQLSWDEAFSANGLSSIHLPFGSRSELSTPSRTRSPNAVSELGYHGLGLINADGMLPFQSTQPSEVAAGVISPSQVNAPAFPDNLGQSLAMSVEDGSTGWKTSPNGETTGFPSSPARNITHNLTGDALQQLPTALSASMLMLDLDRSSDLSDPPTEPSSQLGVDQDAQGAGGEASGGLGDGRRQSTRRKVPTLKLKDVQPSLPFPSQAKASAQQLVSESGSVSDIDEAEERSAVTYESEEPVSAQLSSSTPRLRKRKHISNDEQTATVGKVGNALKSARSKRAVKRQESTQTGDGNKRIRVDAPEMLAGSCMAIMFDSAPEFSPSKASWDADDLFEPSWDNAGSSSPDSSKPKEDSNVQMVAAAGHGTADKKPSQWYKFCAPLMEFDEDGVTVRLKEAMFECPYQSEVRAHGVLID